MWIFKIMDLQNKSNLIPIIILNNNDIKIMEGYKIIFIKSVGQQ